MLRMLLSWSTVVWSEKIKYYVQIFVICIDNIFIFLHLGIDFEVSNQLQPSP